MSKKSEDQINRVTQPTIGSVPKKPTLAPAMPAERIIASAEDSVAYSGTDLGDHIHQDQCQSGATTEPIGGDGLTNLVDRILEERGHSHGDVVEQMRVSDDIKKAMKDCMDFHTLNPVTRECLDMIAFKMSRIIVGDETFHDHWIDIQGYAKLGEKNVCPKQ